MAKGCTGEEERRGRGSQQGLDLHHALRKTIDIRMRKCGLALARLA